MEKFLKMHKAIERKIALLNASIDLLKDDEICGDVAERDIEIEILEAQIQALKQLWSRY